MCTCVVGLHGLINNAGIPGPIGPTELISRAATERVVAVNLLGTIDVTKVFLRLVRRSRGRVVNVQGKLAIPGLGPYCVAKAGIEAFSDTLR